MGGSSTGLDTAAPVGVAVGEGEATGVAGSSEGVGVGKTEAIVLATGCVGVGIGSD